MEGISVAAYPVTESPSNDALACTDTINSKKTVQSELINIFMMSAPKFIIILALINIVSGRLFKD
jgi:hypothetical protein